MSTKTKLKLPPGWKKCKVPLIGFQKWRHMESLSWVVRNPDGAIRVGINGEPIPTRFLCTAQQAICGVELLRMTAKERSAG